MALNRITADSITDGTIIAADVADGTITAAKLVSGLLPSAIANSAASYANSAFASANAAIAVNTTQNNSITASFSTANGAVAVNTTQNNSITVALNTANAAFTTANNVQTGFKNRIINGDMRIDQRNAGASITADDGYCLDRWKFNSTQNGKGTIQQNAGAVTPPSGFINYLGFTSNSAYSVLSTDSIAFLQNIEGFNAADLNWGTANAQAVTLSFWVRSSLTGTFGGAFENASVDRAYPFTYTISAANTWEQKTVTVAGDTTGTWGTDNGVGIRVWFNLGAGATFSGTAGAWAGADYRSATGATSVVGTSGATFYITGVQLELGSTATPFEFRSIGTELGLCQRYYIQKSSVVTTSSIYQSVDLPVSMRTSPTIGTVTFESGTGATFATASGSALAGVDKVTWVYQGANHSGIAICMIPLSAEL